MSVGYNVSEGSMDFNSGSNLTSGIQDRCCTRWWRSRNGFERWMVMIVILLGITIIALSVAVGVLDSIAHPFQPEASDPVVEVRHLFDHMEEQTYYASQLMADTGSLFNQTLLALKAVKTRLSGVDDEKVIQKRYIDDMDVLERLRRDATPVDNDTTIPPSSSSENITKPVKVNITTEGTNGTEIDVTIHVTTPAPTTPIQVVPTTTPKVELNTTTVNNTSDRINTTTQTPTTNMIEILRNELNKTKHELNNKNESLNIKIEELNNMKNKLDSQSLVLNKTIEKLIETNYTLVQTNLLVSSLKDGLNTTNQTLGEKIEELNNLKNRLDNESLELNKTIEKLIESNQTLLQKDIRIRDLESFINETTGMFTPTLEILILMDKPINQTSHLIIGAKKLLLQVNNTLNETSLPYEQKEKYQNQTQIMSEYLDEMEVKLRTMTSDLEDFMNMSIVIKDHLKNVQAKLFNDPNNTELQSALHDTRQLLNQGVVNLKESELKFSEIRKHLMNTAANLSQTLDMLNKIEVEINQTEYFNITTPISSSLNLTTDIPNSNSTESNNIKSTALKSASTEVLPGKFEILIMVLSAVIFQGYY